MPRHKPPLPPSPPPPVSTTRARTLAAAERLLDTGRPEFSMRELAVEAGLSFATPFNLFGSKGAIMQALSAERIATMQQRFAMTASLPDAPSRVLAAVAVAVAVMAEQPAVNRAVMGTLGAPSREPGDTLSRSSAFWAQAVGDAAGLSDPVLARAVLPGQLAFAFRGVLSFWTAGEIADADFPAQARRAVAAIMLGFATPEARHDLLSILAATPAMDNKPPGIMPI